MHRDDLVLVTGATGFIGNNLVRHLLKSGRRVRAFACDSVRSLDGLDVEVVKGDVSDYESIRLAMGSVDVVYHLAAAIDFQGSYHQDQIWRVNVQGTKNVVNACLESGVKRLVHCSSIHALSFIPRKEPVDEQRPLALGPSHMFYDRTKAEAEQVVLNATRKGLNAVIVAPTWVIGPNDFGPSASGKVLSRLMQGKLPAIVRGGYHCVDVRDVVDGAIQAERNGRSGERYILTSEYAHFTNLAALVARWANVSKPICLPYWIAVAVAPIVEYGSRLFGCKPLMTVDSVRIIRNHQDIRVTKAAEELGFRPRPLEESVSDTLQWFKWRENVCQNGLAKY